MSQLRLVCSTLLVWVGVAGILTACSQSRSLRVDLDSNGLRIDGRKLGPLVVNAQDGYLDFPDSLYPQERWLPKDYRVEPLRQLVASLDSPEVEIRCAPELGFGLVKPLLRAVAQAGVRKAKLCQLEKCVEISLRDPSEATDRFHDSLVQLQMIEDSLSIASGVAPVPEDPALRDGASWHPAFVSGRRVPVGTLTKADLDWGASQVDSTWRSHPQIRLLELEPHPKIKMREVQRMAEALAKSGLTLAILGNVAP